MTELAPPLRLVADEEEPAPSPGPTVFARSISAPAGPPWDQARAAGLEARLGAPLPLSEIVYRLWRLEPWALGRPARYAVAYVRAKEISDRLDTTVVVEGRTIRVRLFSVAEQRRLARRLAVASGSAAVAVLLVGLAVGAAMATRSAAETKLASVNQALSVRERQAEQIESLKEQTRWLNASHVQGQTVGDFLGDLAWASAAKAPGAHIDSLHWERGLMAVQVRGDTPPFAQVDRTVMKVPKPVRPGVWLWGVGPKGAGPRVQPPGGAAP